MISYYVIFIIHIDINLGDSVNLFRFLAFKFYSVPSEEGQRPRRLGSTKDGTVRSLSSSCILLTLIYMYFHIYVYTTM